MRLVGPDRARNAMILALRQQLAYQGVGIAMPIALSIHRSNPHAIRHHSQDGAMDQLVLEAL